jgi:hypothetical protein
MIDEERRRKIKKMAINVFKNTTSFDFTGGKNGQY